MEILIRHPQYFETIEENKVYEINIGEPHNLKGWATLLCYSIFLDYQKINRGDDDFTNVKEFITVCNRNKWNKKELIFKVFNRYYLLNIKRHDYSEGSNSILFEYGLYDLLISGHVPIVFPFEPKVDMYNNLYINLPIRLRNKITTYIP